MQIVGFLMRRLICDARIDVLYHDLCQSIHRGYIFFFEVNTKYISSSELKTSKFSRVRSTSEKLDVFKSRDEIYLVFTDKK